jgi:hypothetical protein
MATLIDRLLRIPDAAILIDTVYTLTALIGKWMPFIMVLGMDHVGTKPETQKS